MKYCIAHIQHLSACMLHILPLFSSCTYFLLPHKQKCYIYMLVLSRTPVTWMFNLPALLIFMLLPTKQHDNTTSDYVQLCSRPLQNPVLSLSFGLAFWGRSRFLLLSCWQFHEFDSSSVCFSATTSCADLCLFIKSFFPIRIFCASY